MNDENFDSFPKSKMLVVLLALSPGPMFLLEIWLRLNVKSTIGPLLLILTGIAYAPYISFAMAFRLTRSPQAGSARNIFLGLFASAAFLLVNFTIGLVGCAASGPL